MHRTCGKVLGATVAVAAAGLLAACGGNDSTASSTPTSTIKSSAAVAMSAPATSAPSVSSAAPEPAPQPSDTATPERPEPAPAPTQQDTSGMADKDRKFLDSLKTQGLTPSSPDIALSIGAYVCQGVAAGASDTDLSTFVNAMAGSDPSFDPAKMPVEKAGKIYIDTAKQTYCK